MHGGPRLSRRAVLISPTSELQLQRHLDRAGAADLVKRAEAAALPPAAQRAGQHLRRLAELRRTEEVDRASQIGAVEDIKKINARLKTQPLA